MQFQTQGLKKHPQHTRNKLEGQNVRPFTVTVSSELKSKDWAWEKRPLASELVRSVAVVDLGASVLGHYLLHLLREEFKLLYRDCGFDPRLPHLRNNFFKQLFAVGSLWMRKAM